MLRGIPERAGGFELELTRAVEQGERLGFVLGDVVSVQEHLAGPEAGVAVPVGARLGEESRAFVRVASGTCGELGVGERDAGLAVSLQATVAEKVARRRVPLLALDAPTGEDPQLFGAAPAQEPEREPDRGKREDHGASRGDEG